MFIIIIRAEACRVHNSGKEQGLNLPLEIPIYPRNVEKDPPENRPCSRTWNLTSPVSDTLSFIQSMLDNFHKKLRSLPSTSSHTRKKEILSISLNTSIILLLYNSHKNTIPLILRHEYIDE